MRALIYDGPMETHVGSVDRPLPGAGEVALRVRACGICGSDVHGFTGESKRRVPGMVMGHEMAGEVAQIGPGADPALLGRRVAVNPTIGCGRCAACRRGETNLCPQRRTIGVNMGARGAFAEVVIVPAENCVPLSDRTTFAEGAFAEPLGVGLHAARLAGAAPGVSLLVIGGGTIGICTLLSAKKLGATVYLAEPVSARLRLAESLGAVPIDASGGVAGSARRFEPDGLDAAVDAVGVAATLGQALAAVRYGGRVIWLGNVEPEVVIPCNPVLSAERSLKGSYAYTAAEYREAVAMIDERRIDLAPLLGETCSLEEAPAMFAALASRAGRAVKVVVEP